MSQMTIAGLQNVFEIISWNSLKERKWTTGLNWKINTKPPFFIQTQFEFDGEDVQLSRALTEFELSQSDLTSYFRNFDFKNMCLEAFPEFKYKSLQCENTRFGKPVSSIDINMLQKSQE